MSFLFNSKKRLSNNLPLQLNYYNDGTLYIPSKKQKEILSSIKSTKLKEIELLDYSINNLQTQLLILKKIQSENINNIEKSKKELIESIKREVNPDLLCSICFDKRVDVVVTPCGHTFCSSCLGGSRECYSCRTKINQTHKIYFS